MFCEYCGLEKRRRELQGHMHSCDSRTEVCQLCFSKVKLRDMEVSSCLHALGHVYYVCSCCGLGIHVYTGTSNHEL